MSGFSSMLATVAMTIREIKSPLVRTKRKPSPSSERYCRAGLRISRLSAKTWWSRQPNPGVLGLFSASVRDGTASATKTADRRKVAASSSRTLAAAPTATKTPPVSGPANWASLGIAVSAAFARSSGIAAQRASAGTIARRARSPGALRIEMTKARVRMSQNGRASAQNNSGTAATAAPAVTSERMLARRNPKRSTSGPPLIDDTSRADPYDRSGEAHLDDAAGLLQDEPRQRHRDHV